MKKNTYVKPEIKQDNSIENKVNVLMNEIRKQHTTKLEIGLHSKANGSSLNSFSLNINGDNNFDNLNMQFNFTLTEKLLKDLLTVCLTNKAIDETYKFEIESLTNAINSGYISGQEFNSKLEQIKLKYKVID